MESEDGAFKSTLWSIVLRSRAGSESDRRAALERLGRTYWPPLFVYLLRKGYSREDAQDAIQGFFAHFLEKELLDRIDPDRGRFRTFLLFVLERFLANERRIARAEKRGGGAPILSLDFSRAETRVSVPAAPGETPEKAYHRAWGLSVLRQAFETLKVEFEKSKPPGWYEAVCARLQADSDTSTYEEEARRLGCAPADFKNLLYLTRRRLRGLIRESIRDTVDRDEDIDREFMELFNSR